MELMQYLDNITTDIEKEIIKDFCKENDISQINQIFNISNQIYISKSIVVKTHIIQLKCQTIIFDVMERKYTLLIRDFISIYDMFLDGKYDWTILNIIINEHIDITQNYKINNDKINKQFIDAYNGYIEGRLYYDNMEDLINQYKYLKQYNLRILS